MSLKILVTGASGFVGKALCERLILDNFSVIKVVRKHYANTKDSIITNEILINDISTISNWLDFLANVDVVVHLAGRAHVLKEKSLDPLNEFRSVNTLATQKLVEASVYAGVKRFIFLSSVGVNGDKTDSAPFRATDIPKPVSSYAISKYEAETSLKDIASKGGMEFVIIRSPLIYGRNAPGNFGKLVNVISRGVPLPFAGITNNKRSFIGLDNLVDLLVRCIDHPSAVNQTFLAADGVSLSTAELVKKISVSLGRKYKLFKLPNFIFYFFSIFLGKKKMMQQLFGNLEIDIEHTMKTLDWSPPLSVDQGFKKLAVFN